MTIQDHRLIILAGPSGAGKTPLKKAVQEREPGLLNRVSSLVLYTSRKARPGERNGIDYHFRSRDEIEKLKGDARFAVVAVRGDLQAVNLEEVQSQLTQGSVFFEGNTYIGLELMQSERLSSWPRISFFLSPCYRQEILKWKQQGGLNLVNEKLQQIMQDRLKRRAALFKKEGYNAATENNRQRIAEAFEELKQAWQFDYIIPNHDGEDSPNWRADHRLTGDAGRAVHKLVSALKGQHVQELEKWSHGLLAGD